MGALCNKCAIDLSYLGHIVGLILAESGRPGYAKHKALVALAPQSVSSREMSWVPGRSSNRRKMGYAQSELSISAGVRPGEPVFLRHPQHRG